MKFIFPKWTNHIPVALTVLGLVVPALLVGIVWYYFSPNFTDVGYAPQQPVPFSHQLHAGQLGMDCRYCHATVERAAHSAIPATSTCMGCHAIIKTDSPKLELVRKSFEKDQGIPWVKVHMLPEYAHFNHSIHVSSGVGCVSCHGRIDHMETVQQSQPLSMSWCLECHRNPTPNLRPVSEVTNMNWHAGETPYDPTLDPTRKRAVNPPQHCSACHY